jgi:hypothetical protein
MRHPDGRTVPIPVHPGRDMPKGTLRNILAIMAHTTPHAALFKVDLTDANLTGTNLANLDMRFATTNGADFTNANLTGTQITPNEFTHAINANITKARLYRGS